MVAVTNKVLHDKSTAKRPNYKPRSFGVAVNVCCRSDSLTIVSPFWRVAVLVFTVLTIDHSLFGPSKIRGTLKYVYICSQRRRTLVIVISS